MRARSALFDVYGDHLGDRGYVAPVAALVRLLEPLGIAAPAVRTAVSRMVAQGWLEPVGLADGRGYRATGHAVRRLSDTGDRVYGRADRRWDGHWHLAMLSLPRDRSARQRLRADLGFLGYAPLTDELWVSPWPREELADVVRESGAEVTVARADRFDPPDAPRRAWDLDALASAYDAWLATAADTTTAQLAAHEDPDEAAFSARFLLVHEWRKFLFRDPGLPDAVLPADWAGDRAAACFDRLSSALLPRASAYVDACLDQQGVS